MQFTFTIRRSKVRFVAWIVLITFLTNTNRFMISISAILITYNEEKNIDRCLKSLSWISEVVIVDSFSTDKTEIIAKTYSNVHFLKHPWEGFSKNKEVALENTSNNWIFWIDADEEVTENLYKEIEKLQTDKIDQEMTAYAIPRDTFFMGDIVKYSGWSNQVVRIFNKKYYKFDGKPLHEGLIFTQNTNASTSTSTLTSTATKPCAQDETQAETQGTTNINNNIANKQIVTLKGRLNHYSYQSLYQYFDKMNSYGKVGAQELMNKNKYICPFVILFTVVFTFIRAYFFKFGFLDGPLGFIISLGSAFSNFIKYTNYYYLKKQGHVE